MFHGKGGYTWESVYSMPIWLRKFVHKEIYDFYEKEKEEYEKSINGRQQISAGTDQNTLSKIKNSVAKTQIPDFVSTVKKSKK